MKHRNATRNALVTSIVSVLLCVGMLVGTTFAWFTDEVVTGMNTIAAGNLDVELLADGNKVDSNTKLFDDVTLWEPGVVVYENLQVANVGTLALQYQMALNFGNENDLNGHKLSEILEVAVLDQTIDSSTMSRADVLELAKTAVPTDLNSFAMAGELEADTSSPAFAVVIFWEPNANEVDNLYNANNDQTTTDGEPLHIEFGVNLQATQKMHEEDSFGPDYDEDATIHSYGVNSADEAYEVFSSFDQSGNRGTVALFEDFNTADASKHWSSNREYALRAAGTDVTFNLNGHTVNHNTTYQNGKNTGYTYLFTTAYGGKLTVNGEGSIHSENTDGSVSIFYAQGPSEITINGGNYHAVRGVPVWAGSGAKVVINGGTFTSSGTSNEELIYSSGGVIDIYGGFFHNTEWESRPVNVANANRNTGRINIYGGTFVNFDPSTGGDDPGQIKVAEGYKVVSETQENGDVWYTVVKNTATTTE